MTHADTIVALSTPVQGGLRSILRMSGPRSFEFIKALSASADSRSRVAVNRSVESVDAIRSEDVIDPLERRREVEPLKELVHAQPTQRTLQMTDSICVTATLYPFVSPRSSTAEDVIEIHLPGSPFLVKAVLQRLMSLGARQAEPGEFTARAFFNGKLDLTSAEGIAATIAASNRAELSAARQLLGGELARRLTPMLDELVRLLALIEVGIDFTEEDVTFIAREEVAASLKSIDDSLRDLIEQSPRLERLSHEPRIVLTGRPNAGKSTLINRLSGTTRAVVSDVAGTTRDAISARIALRRGFITLIDVAGTEGAGEADASGRCPSPVPVSDLGLTNHPASRDVARRDGDSDGPLQRCGVEPDSDSITTESASAARDVAAGSIAVQMQSAARRALAQADAVLLLIDASDPRPPIPSPRAPDLVVYSKSDLGSVPVGAIGISVRQERGLAELFERLDEIAFGTATGRETALSINSRHVDAIGRARESVGRALRSADGGAELVAFDLRLAIDHLGSILGNVSPDDVLGRIFSSFCIGK